MFLDGVKSWVNTSTLGDQRKLERALPQRPFLVDALTDLVRQREIPQVEYARTGRPMDRRF
jgi:hypothetical protein